MRELSTSVAPSVRERLRDRPPEPAGGAGEQHGLARELHARNLPQPGSDRLAAHEALRLLGDVPDAPPAGGHPCHNAHEALKEAGYDPEVIKVHGLGVGPEFMHLKTAGRKEVEELTGSPTVPVLVTDAGEVISDSQQIVDWAEANPAK